jgi:hypothetical protein
MTKKKEAEKEVSKDELVVWASPAWSIKREGQEIKLISGCGFYPDERPGLVKLKISVEEV